MNHTRWTTTPRQAIGLPIVLLMLLFTVARLQAQGPTVKVLLFYSETCPHCHTVLEQVLPPLQQKYGRQLKVRQLEIGDPQNYDFLLKLEQVYRIPPDLVGVPEMFIGTDYLIGSLAIDQKLDGLIQRYLAEGGVDYPSLPTAPEPPVADPIAPTSTASPESTLAAPVAAKVEDSRVEFYVFYDSHCDPCMTLMNQVLPTLLARHPAGLVYVDAYDIEHQGYDLMRSLETHHGLEVGAMPEVFIGDEALLGLEQIEARLPALVDRYVSEGGLRLPVPAASSGGPSGQASVATPVPTNSAVAPPVHLAYFYQVGCKECDRAQLDLRYLQERYPQLRVVSFDSREKAAMLEQLGARASVPENRRLIAPAVFVGNDALVGEEVGAANLQKLVDRYAMSGAPAFSEEVVSADAASGIIARFQSFGPAAVAVAGLVDGLNPCAFATVVFFVSYLALMGRRGRAVLAVGGAFTLGVFLTYLGVGFGLLNAVAALPFFAQAGPWLYGVTAVLCIVLAVISFHDFVQARRGQPAEMRLKLPTFLRRRINQVVREGATVNAFVPVAFVTGGVISLIELACTGQIYLPVIVFVLGVPEMRASAFSYLLLYNVMFIIPLIVVFVAAYWGTTSEKMAMQLSRRTAQVKLVTALLFLLMAVWLGLTVIASVNPLS